MKKPLLILAFFAFITSGYSQIVTLVDPINVLYGSVANTGEILEPHWDVINATGSTRDFGCRRVILQQVPGAQHQFCWGEICSAWGTADLTSTEIVTLHNQEATSTFYAKYNHAGNAGQSIVRFCWFDNSNPTSEFCYDVNFCVDGECILAGVEENTPAASIEMITPNPIQNLGFINYNFTSAPNAGKMKIYNALGGLVKEISLTAKKGTVIVGADEFENGIYFCSIEENGRVYQTQRMVVNR